MPNVFASHGDTPAACYSDGIDAGQSDQFNQGLYETCQGIGGGDEYYDGFIEGCMDADNSREVCEQATDAGNGGSNNNDDEDEDNESNSDNDNDEQTSEDEASGNEDNLFGN
jgi:hypothetical protein